MTAHSSVDRLERWRRSLLDLTLRNRLLDAREGRRCVALAGCDPVALAEKLDGGVELAIEPWQGAAPAADEPAAAALARHRLLVERTADELDRSLVAMARSARESLEEGGAQTLWVGLGLLRWQEPGAAPDDPPRHAPLVLWPVELRRAGAGDRYRVVPADEEPRVNETLVEKLRVDAGITVALPEPGDDAALDVAAVCEAFEVAVAGRGWAVVRGARLGIFSFTKFVMWNDLAARADELLAAPLVAHLATSAGQPLPDAGPVPAVDDPAAPPLACPLDADATQLAAVRAAEAGRTFVLQGPPGTGKSQTISNLIAQCLGRGQTVLFVSEKIAALEVVQRRLAGAGLGDFCLELHSHRARKRAVVDELGRVLERAWRPAGAGVGDDGKLAAARRTLDDYVRAMHAPTPLGTTVHAALTRLIELRDVPRIALDAAALGTNLPAEALDAGWLAARRDALVEYAGAWEHVREATGASPAGHPWRDSRLADWGLSTADAVEATLGEVDAALAALEAALAGVDRAIPGLRPVRAADIVAVGALAEAAARSTRPGAELVTDAGPSTAAAAPAALVPERLSPADVPRTPAAWVALERRRRAVAAELGAPWTDALLDRGAGAPAMVIGDDELEVLAARFHKWAPRFVLWRWLALRRARARLRGVADGPLPPDARIADDLDAALAARRCARLLDEAQGPARRWLGALAGDRGDLRDVDLDAVDGAIAWAGALRAAFDAAAACIADPARREAAWRSLVAAVSHAPPAAAGKDAGPDWAEVGRAVDRWRAAIDRLASVCAVEPEADDPAGWVRARLPGWRAAVPSLRDWAAYVRARRAIAALGLGAAAAACERGDIAPDRLADAWERAALLAWIDARLAEHEILRDFHGSRHAARIAQFAELDRGSLVTARARLVRSLAERVPRPAPGADVADDGELGILLRELKKQRRHKPLRALFRQIPTLLGRLKPCLLMSPLSVAQYLDPSLPPFDLVVFDEASQIPTADAIGVLARGRAAVVVGDSRQLPPTRFFEIDPGARGDDGDDDEYEELESILDECVAARVPELRLGWHYRSRHEDLIAFSNRRYYDDALHVFPSPAARVPELGVAWRKVDGVYDRAGTRTNRVEAEAVVAEVVARLRDPARASRSLGIVTFNRAQQALIEDLLDDARRADPSLERWFGGEAPDGGEPVAEPVIVKNLETIQGDERDVILFSIGFGPDAAGKLTLNFGPLGKTGGERRLNVAVTRAREQLVVFSSIEPAAILDRVTDATPVGVRHLGELLAYVAAGGGAAVAAGEAAAPSPLVAAIARALGERGWTVQTGIGCAAYRIDLAVVDPDDPGRYVLGIECDGAHYASAATARDRDRLRAQVLGGLGWRLHRIWALDWWHDPAAEAQRAHGAVIAAVAAARAARTPRGATTKLERPREAASRPVRAPALAAGSGRNPTPPAGVGEPAIPPALAPRRAPITAPPPRAAEPARAASEPYRAASIPAGRRKPDDLHEPRFEAELGKIIDQVLDVEAPVHLDLLARRVGAYFGIGRVTAKVVDRVREVAATRAQVGDPGDPHAVWRRDQDPTVPPPVRAGGEAAETRRDAGEIPLAEVAAAASLVLVRNVGLPLDDLVRETARALGFARLGDRVQRRMREGIELLASRGGCRLDGAHASLPAG